MLVKHGFYCLVLLNTKVTKSSVGVLRKKYLIYLQIASGLGILESMPTEDHI